MAKFNEKTTGTNIIENKSGFAAYKMSPEEKLISQVLTSFFNEKKYYGDNSKEILESIEAVLSINPRLVANLAIFARKEFNMRSISTVLLGELAHHLNGKKYAKEAISQAIVRADDMTELVAYYINKYGKPIPNSMKKGLTKSFKTFNEYSLAKYNRKEQVTLKDILCLIHPAPDNNEQEQLWKRLLEDNLAVPFTWETQLSKLGNKKEVWEALIETNALGYMAMIRNFRNILRSNPDNINKVYEFLSNEQAVLKNKQLPFRYYSAYKALEESSFSTSKAFNALEKAIKISVQNISQMKGKTLIAADISGSMQHTISENSEVKCCEISTLLLSIANSICEESISVTFDTQLKKINLSNVSGIISNAKLIDSNGGGTDITLPIKFLLDNKIFVDRIIILSDNEINSGWDDNSYSWSRSSNKTCQSLVEEYKKNINPNVWVHAIDLMGYGTQQFHGEKVNIVSGWSEKVFDFIDLVEKGASPLMETIQDYYFKDNN